MKVLDVNVLIAAFMPQHFHHHEAVQVLQDLYESRESVMLHGMVQASFIRICTKNITGFKPALVSECIDFLRSLRSHLMMVHTNEHPEHLSYLERRLTNHKNPSALVNDAWLAAIADSFGGSVVSFDKYFK